MSTEYTDRVMEQAREWLAGRPKHNEIDGECCPDFSCCFQDLFVQDRAVRLKTVNAYARRHGYKEILDS